MKMSLDVGIKRYEKHSKVIHQTLISKEEAENVLDWLKELKSYKESRVGCEYCKHNFREQHERPCSLCQHNFMDMFEREVTADEEGSESE